MRPDASKKLAAAAPKQGPNPVVVGAVIAVALIVAVVVAIVVGSSGRSGGATAGSAQPAGVSGGTGGGILVNAATAKSNAPTLDLFEDFQCPNCADLEKVLGPELKSLADTGAIKLVVHTLSFLDDKLGNDSSSRSANAAACAADAGRFLPYHGAVFAGQPAREGAGYTDDQLTEFAKTAGITGPVLTTWQKCTSSGQHHAYVTQVQEASDRAGVTGTPTIKLNGKDITEAVRTTDALVAAVKAATK